MYNVSQEQLQEIDSVLKQELLAIGIDCVIVVDMAGNIIAQHDNGQLDWDITAFAALAAGNFAAVDAMAEIVGEHKFSLHFHRGETESIHFSKIGDDLLLISVFGNETSLGFIRLKTDEVIERIREIWEG
ncbi:MAG: roadblock/LC7 domain-containing protein [Thermodesulfobacteriota bacterium]